ncbi:MAG TPA: hypothetical protein VGH80_07490 [Xanthomonadaceae bacterium]
MEDSNESRLPCPVCGCLSRQATEVMHETLVLREHLRIKGRHAGVSRPYFDERSGASFFRRNGEWHHLFRLIDRENNRYVETIKRHSTGEVLHHVDEPLSEHTNHGSAKHRRR